MKPIIKLILIISLFLTSVVTFLSCDSPTEPKEINDYIFYLEADSYPENLCFRYYSKSNKVDTVVLPYNGTFGFDISSSGDRLYLADNYTTRIVETDSFNLIGEIPLGGPLLVSPNDKYIIYVGNKTMTILNAEDFSTVFYGSNEVFRLGRFTPDCKTYYYPNDLGVVKMDMTKAPFESHQYSVSGNILQVIPSHDESKIFMYKIYGNFTYSFEVYDITLDSIIFFDIQEPGVGEMEITPDGEYVFYTNPGNLLYGPIPPNFIKVYNIYENTSSELPIPITNSPIYDSLHIQNLAVSPDGRYMVGNGFSSASFVVIDINKMKVIDDYYLGLETHINLLIWDIICQKGL